MTKFTHSDKLKELRRISRKDKDKLNALKKAGHRAWNKGLVKMDMEIPHDLYVKIEALANDGSSGVLSPHLKRKFIPTPEFLGFEASANALGEAAFLTNERAVSTLLKKYARERWWESVTTYRFVYPGPAFVRLLRALRGVMEILAAEPVMVDTGQYQDKYQLQTYADVENEIGNFLSSGLGNYEAKVKILTTEYTIRTRPAPEVLSGQQLTERIGAIRRQMRERGYTRHYQDVAAEIHTRAAFYRGLADTPPPHSGGNGASRPRPPQAGAGGTAAGQQEPPPPPPSAFSRGPED